MIEAGKIYSLANGVRRITAPNPGVMTGAGTNTYLLGEKNVVVIDPGPMIEEHCQAIMAAVADRGGKLEAILVTHTHPDHSPSAKRLAELSGAPIIGEAIAQDGFQDDEFMPDQGLQDQQVLTLAGRHITALHTPGHVGNHYCFFDQASGLVFTGDHIMQGSTVVIIPPAGDMKDYIASLEKLLSLPMQGLAPGHGELIDTPVEEVQHIIAHRMGREAKIAETLRAEAKGSLESLTPLVYGDVDPKLHIIASLSLWAHLRKLQAEQRVLDEPGAFDGDKDALWHWQT